MQGPRVSSQQRGPNPTELPGHAPERPRRNPTASKTAAPDPSRQNPPDRPRRQNLRVIDPSLSKPIPTDTKPDAKPVLSAIGHHSSRPVEPGRKRVASPLEKAIYHDVLRTVKNVPDLLFKDHRQDLQKVLRTLTRRDLPGIMQGIQTSPRFLDICENSGLFHVEPPLWDMVCDETQAGRL